MKSAATSFLVLFALSILQSQTIPEKISEKDFSIGKTLLIKSVILEETRELNIYLPQGYSKDSLKTYPVIYLLDGSKEEDFIHIAGIVQFGSFSWINMIPKSIVVGISNVDRKRDFTAPSGNERDQKEFPSSGKSENFIDFIENELQPFIAATYRVHNENTLLGQSLGGLLATEILLKKPELFDNYIIVSPSLWWNDEKLLNQKFKVAESISSIYIAVGKEGDVMERTAKELFNKLNASKSPNTALYFEFMEDKTHGDALHQAVYNAFEMIFGGNTKKNR
ncbi:alpha/beta hydrolase [Flavobacteriaceae bacterium M23B6Z8]